MWRLDVPLVLSPATRGRLFHADAPVHIWREARALSTFPGGQTVAERLCDGNGLPELVMFFELPQLVIIGDQEFPFVLRSVKLSLRTTCLADLVPNQPPVKHIHKWRKQEGVKRSTEPAGARRRERTWEDVLMELPRKKRVRREGEPPSGGHGAVKDKLEHDPIKVIKGLLFSRFLRSTRDFSQAMGAAKAYENSDYEAEDRDPKVDQGRSTRDRARQKLDVLSILLDRREFHADRLFDQIEAITLFSDASPNCGLEFQGMICDMEKTATAVASCCQDRPCPTAWPMQWLKAWHSSGASGSWLGHVGRTSTIFARKSYLARRMVE